MKLADFFSWLAKVFSILAQPPPQYPWMDLLSAHLGQREDDPKLNAWLSPYWKKLCGLNFTNLVGLEHAWCGLTAATVLFLSDLSYAKDPASAASWREYGTLCEYKFGALIPIRHVSGAWHITFFVKWIDEKNRIALLRGGNQNNTLCEATYNLSGNDAGHDECPSGPRWPVKA